MKKELLASTALIGASLLIAAPAVAQNITAGGKATTVTLTGAFDFQVGFSDQDVEGFSDQSGDVADGPERGYGIITNSELAVNARGTTDAGMKWRAKVELETDTDASGNTDEMALTLSGSWGSFVIGNEDGPEDLMDYGSEQACGSAGSGCTGGDYKDWTNIKSVSSRLADEGTLKQDSSDSTKVVYYTPRINGLQLGVGFSPDRGAEGDASTTDDDGDFNSFWGFGVNYIKKFDGFNVALGAVGAIADDDDSPGKEDLRAWRVGGVLGFGAFKIGAGYQDVGDGGQDEGVSDDDMTAFDVGIGWSQGPVKLGVGYLHAEVGSEFEVVTVAGTPFDPTDPTYTPEVPDTTADIFGEGEHDLVALGATYTLGKGLVVYGDVWWYSSDITSTTDATNDTREENDAFGVLIGTTVKF